MCLNYTKEMINMLLISQRVEKGKINTANTMNYLPLPLLANLYIYIKSKQSSKLLEGKKAL